MCQQDRIRDIIKSKLLNNDQFNISINPGTTQKNYFGCVYKVEINDINKNRYIIKTHGEDVAKNIRVNIVEKFKREALAYNVIFKEYEKIQKDLTMDETIQFPLCIYADEEYLILEDLSNQSFKDIDHKSILDLNHTIMMIKEIAKFHACSFALKHKKPDFFENIRTLLKRPNLSNKDRRNFIVDKIWNWTMDAIDDDMVKNKLINKKNDYILEYDINNYDQSNFVVISHGDYNIRNILFHYDDDLKPDGMRMIDFQLCYVTSPIADLLFSIFSSTDSQLRQDHYSALQDIYYESLRHNLALLNCDADLCYPEVAYRSDFRKYFPREFITILVITRLMCIAFKDESVPAETCETIFEYNSTEAEVAYKNRVNQVIADFDRFGYI